MSVPSSVGSENDAVHATVISFNCVPTTCAEVDLDATCAQILEGNIDATCGGACTVATGCNSRLTRRSDASNLDFIVIQKLGSSTIDATFNILVVNEKGVATKQLVTSTTSKVIELPGVTSLRAFMDAPALPTCNGQPDPEDCNDLIACFIVYLQISISKPWINMRYMRHQPLQNTILL